MNNISKSLPLAKRMRPININEIVGQKHIINKDSLLYKMITQDSLYSILLCHNEAKRELAMEYPA